MSADRTVGFVGLGAMGAHMAARLLDAGHALAVFDTRAEAMAPHVARGALQCASAAAVADAADTVLVSLPTPDVVREVADGLLRVRHEPERGCPALPERALERPLLAERLVAAAP